MNLEASSIDLHQLPHGLQRIVGAIGLVKAHKLLSRLGGTRIRCLRDNAVPESVSALIGEADGRKLMAVLWSDSVGLRDKPPIVTLPKADKLLTQIRDLAVWEACSAGKTDAAVAMDFGLTERWVSKIKLGQSRKRPITWQRDLFDASSIG